MMLRVFCLLSVLLVHATTASGQDQVNLPNSRGGERCMDLAEPAQSDCKLLAVMCQYASNMLPDILASTAGARCYEFLNSAEVNERKLVQCLATSFVVKGQLDERSTLLTTNFEVAGILNRPRDCANLLVGIAALAQKGTGNVRDVTLVPTAQTCAAIASIAEARGLVPRWAACGSGTNQNTLYQDCVAPIGSERLAQDWTEALKGCAAGEVPSALIRSLSVASEQSGRAAPTLTCAYVLTFASDNGLVPDSKYAGLAARIASFETKAAEKAAEIAAAEAREADVARATFPDTYGKLIAPGQPEAFLRAIETASSTHVVIPGNSLFATGLVDVLLSCPVDISLAEKATLLAFATSGLLEARNS